MVYLVISDIHGCASNLKTVLEAFENKYDGIICCGDFLYHGPRNGVPAEYDPKETMALLEKIRGRIVGVRGNCDGEVDQMVLNFPLLSDNQTLPFMKKGEMKKIFIHHGHKYSSEELMRLIPEGSVIVSGHTHVTVLKQADGYIWLNPGSVSLPKGEDGKTCGLLEITETGTVKIELRKITGEIIKSLEA